MEMNNNDLKYLPYGTVVKLKFDDRYYMITGLQIEINDKENRKKYYCDYISIPLPQGYTGEDQMMLFNSENIEKIIFNGYMDKKISSFYDDIKWSVNRRKKNE